MPPALFNDFLLYFRYSPAIEVMVGRGSLNLYSRFNSRRQLKNRIAYGLVEVFQFLSVHSPVESPTDIRTG